MVKQAASRSLLSRITTSAYWSPTANTAQARLDPLVEVRLQQLITSCSDFHRQFVPLQNVIEATRVARPLGVRVFLNVVVTRTSITRLCTIRRAFEAAGVFTPPFCESPVIPFGRARPRPKPRLAQIPNPKPQAQISITFAQPSRRHFVSLPTALRFPQATCNCFAICANSTCVVLWYLYA